MLDVGIRNAIVGHFIAFTGIVNQGFPSYQYYPGAAAVEVVYEGAFWRDVARELMGRVLMGVVAMGKEDYVVE